MVLAVLAVFLIGAATGDVINTVYSPKADEVTREVLLLPPADQE